MAMRARRREQQSNRCPRTLLTYTGVAITALGLLLASAGDATSKVSLKTLHAFSALKANPNAPLLQARDGSFYGTTQGDGPFSGGGGTVFKLTPGGVLTILHAFDCSPEGCGPFAALLQASDGNFYGTTQGGGAFGNGSRFGGGTVFKLTPSGVLTTLHDFDCGTEGAGCLPSTALLQASDGNFYGTT
jgi:uncharacterized repeat protein (TIGR03803 family)